jgi:hypothetical protein
MVVSQRKLKEKFKNKLPEKTHIREGVYELMSRIMEVKLDALCESILYKYEQSGDKAVRKSHVEQAWVTEIIILNRGSKNDIKHIFENE